MYISSFICFWGMKHDCQTYCIVFIGHGTPQGSLYPGLGAGGLWWSISWWPFHIIDQNLLHFLRRTDAKQFISHVCYLLRYIFPLWNLNISSKNNILFNFNRFSWKNFWIRDHIWCKIVWWNMHSWGSDRDYAKKERTYAIFRVNLWTSQIRSNQELRKLMKLK